VNEIWINFHRVLLAGQTLVNRLNCRFRANIIFSTSAHQHGNTQSWRELKWIEVIKCSQRRLVDVTLKFTSRKTDASESYGARVDVTGMYPFLVHALRPVFDKES